MQTDYMVDVERSVLGSVLLECNTLPPGLDLIVPADFIVKPHRQIFEAMLRLADDRQPIDLVTVAGVLNGTKGPNGSGWSSFLSELIEATPTSANLDHYTAILRSQARRRDFVTVMSRALERAKDQTVDGDDLMMGAVTELGRLAESRAVLRPTPLSAAIRQEYKEIEMRGRGEIVGLPTGFKDLDDLTGGMPLGVLIVIAARPGMGKSAFVGSVLRHHTLKQKKRALIFSLEMSAQEQAQRMLSGESRINLRRIRSGKLADSDYPKLANASGRLWTDLLGIVDRAGLSITELRSVARQYAAQCGDLELIVVDYIQLMEGIGDNREQQVASISRGLKNLAMELRIPVIGISQLNRALESRNDKRPMLSDLRESGSIEQDADQVIFIYRDEYYHPKSTDEGLAEISVSKNRNGPTGMRKLRWFGEYTTFAPLESERDAPAEREESEYEYEN